MKKGWVLTQDVLDTLLNWLAPDREQAGIKYEEIRRALVRIFTSRGCVPPEDLADETINRVASKLPEFKQEFEGNPVRYFYAVANKVILENRTATHKKEERLNLLSHSNNSEASHLSQTNDTLLDRLEHCLKQLSDDERELVLQYYQVDKSTKHERRLHLTEKIGITLNVLRIKVHRLKKKLENCVLKKLSE